LTPNGEIVFGGIFQSENATYIVQNFNCTLVQDDSVKQFCGYDSEGNEIFDGDTVMAYGKENTVNLVTFYDLKNCRKK
jgi:hypothetical protein